MRGNRTITRPAIGGRLTVDSNIRKLKDTIGSIQRRLDGMDEAAVEMRQRIDDQDVEIVELKAELNRRKGGRPKKAAKAGPKTAKQSAAATT